MKKARKLLACIMAVIIAAACASPAFAEGYAFNWDQDDDNTDGPHCESIFLLNLDTDTVCYTLNADEERPMASMTKIMTYIVAYETIPDIENTVITVPQSVEDELAGTGSSLAGVQVGEELTGLSLLYLMMVPSGNDAALTLMKYVDQLYAEGKLSAEDESGGEGFEPVTVEDDEYPGTDYDGESYFVYLMNKKAEELGCTHTHFTNPHGLYNPDHYTTAREMATITKYAMTLPSFTEITGTTAYVKPVTNMSSEESTCSTTNKMLTNYIDSYGMNYYHQYTTGIKTGSLDEAGYCITASATYDGYTYIAVCMGAPMYDENGNDYNIHGEMLDARSLFRWALTSLEKKTVAVSGEVMSSVSLKYAWQQDELQLVAEETVSVVLPETVDESSILVTADVPDSVEAPVKKGEEIGTATLTYAGEVIATVPLVAAESVSKSEVLEVWEQGKSVISSPWFLGIMAVIALLIVVYIILIIIYRRKQKNLRRVRRRRNL